MYDACIVMSTFNGARYLREQVTSLLNQSQQNVRVYVRDDGSTDETKAILAEYENQNVIDVEYGQNIGVTRSFLTALKNAPEAEYYFFSDQDDVWHQDKVHSAIEQMRRLKKNLVAYCGAYSLIDGQGRPLEGKLFDVIPFDIRSTLCYNCAVGATMGFSRDLRKCICEKDMPDVQIHDWWIILVCLSLDGDVVYDCVSHLDYRQHGDNEIGCSRSLIARIRKRLPWGKVQRKMFHARRTFAKELFRLYRSDMSAKTRDIIRQYSDYDHSLITRVRAAFLPMHRDFSSRLRLKGYLARFDMLMGNF